MARSSHGFPLKSNQPPREKTRHPHGYGFVSIYQGKPLGGYPIDPQPHEHKVSTATGDRHHPPLRKGSGGESPLRSSTGGCPSLPLASPQKLLVSDMRMGQYKAAKGPQVVVLVSIYQGFYFWFLFLTHMIPQGNYPQTFWFPSFGFTS